MTNEIINLMEAAREYVTKFNKEYPRDSGNYYGMAFQAGANWMAEQRQPVPPTIYAVPPALQGDVSAFMNKFGVAYVRFANDAPFYTVVSPEAIYSPTIEKAKADDAVMRMLGSIENRLMNLQGPARASLENQMSALMDRYLGIMENVRDVGQMIEPISGNVAEILGLMRPKPEEELKDMYLEAIHRSTDESGQSAGFTFAAQDQPSCSKKLVVVDGKEGFYTAHPDLAKAFEDQKDIISGLNGLVEEQTNIIKNQEALTAEQAEKIRTLEADLLIAQGVSKGLMKAQAKLDELRSIFNR